jgi:hypothetical protein
VAREVHHIWHERSRGRQEWAARAPQPPKPGLSAQRVEDVLPQSAIGEFCADVKLAEEFLSDAQELGDGVARRLLADLAYRSEDLREELAEAGILLATERAQRRPGVRQRIEIAFASLKRVFGLGETLATTFVGLARRIATKITAYTYAFLVNCLLGHPQGKIKELWA